MLLNYYFQVIFNLKLILYVAKINSHCCDRASLHFLSTSGPVIVVRINSLCSSFTYPCNLTIYFCLCCISCYFISRIVSLLLRKDMKVVLTLLVVNGTFVLCWLPHFIGITCLTFTHGLCPFHDNFFTITTMLAMLNSGCNPFIYTLTYRKFRRAFKKVFPWLRSSRTGNINSSAE